MTTFLQFLQSIFYDHSESRLRSLWRLLIGIALGFLVLGTLRALARTILAFLLMLTAQIPFSVLGNAQQLAQQLNTAFEQFPLLNGIYLLIILSLVILAFILYRPPPLARLWFPFQPHLVA